MFAHFSAIQMDGFRTLKQGARVSYDLVQGPKGQLAQNIRTVDTSAARVEGAGGSGSLACQMLQYFAKAKMLLVPYRGVSPATTALMVSPTCVMGAKSFSVS